METDQKVIINELGIQERNLWTMNTPIQIMINLLSDNMTIAEAILESISVDLIIYIRHFYQVDQIDPQSLDKFKQYITNLFQMISSELGCLWHALGSMLTQEIMSLSDSAQKIVAIDLIAFVLREIQPSISEHASEENRFENE